MGRSGGFETMGVGSEGGDAVVAAVRGEGGDRLKVPVSRLDQLEPYSAAGNGDAPPPKLHRLGATVWQRQREKTRAAIRQMAAELLDLYARRQVAAGFSFPPDTAWQRELESAFLYEDTPDQRRASEEVKRDMERALPMDRLLVGDVGYGKTEVALRAAFKALKLAVAVLPLTATPIPRPLHLSLAGLRDLTLLETPPKDRSPVVTFIEPWDDGLIEEALARELDRGGQVYFVHNRIETIDTIAERVRALAPPRARIAVAHGKLREAELDAVIARFVPGEVDILVSTMIVEAGLDVPNADTMIVNRADQLGLAQ